MGKEVGEEGYPDGGRDKSGTESRGSLQREARDGAWQVWGAPIGRAGLESGGVAILPPLLL